ncbi:hypothetical protein N8714_01300 [Rhodobacteraceae bacterium]|nr:hypothetical protein [Paracoccaceae bacterium]
MKVGIIGGRGMIGSNLVMQLASNCDISIITRENFHNSKNKFDTLFVSAADARKYIVNNQPINDLVDVANLALGISRYTFDRLVLISTVDVYGQVGNVGNEDTKLTFEQPSYGDNRLFLENILRGVAKDAEYQIIRLQGIIANNLTKNVIYDIKNKHEIEKVNPNCTMQFYPIELLSKNIEICASLNEEIVNLSCEPVNLLEIFKQFAPDLLHHTANSGEPTLYDVRSKHCEKLIGNKDYWITKKESMAAIEKYLKT